MSDVPVLTSSHETFIIFFLLCPAEEGNNKVALVGTWHPARVNTSHLPGFQWKRNYYSITEEIIENWRNWRLEEEPSMCNEKRGGCHWRLEQCKWSEILQCKIHDSMLRNYWGTLSLNSAVGIKFEDKGGAQYPWTT